MSEFTNKELKLARESQGIPRWKMGAEIGVSESTVERWESGESMPSPDDIDRFANQIGDATIWHRWMLSHYDSYRRRYINSNVASSLPTLISRLRYETEDVLHIQDVAHRDSLDGQIDDPQLKAQYTKEVKEMIAAATDVLQALLK